MTSLDRTADASHEEGRGTRHNATVGRKLHFPSPTAIPAGVPGLH
jgi:hypothetical protein